MIRQQPTAQEQQAHMPAMATRGPHRANNHRLVKTAPRPRLQRLLISEEESDSSDGVGSDPEDLIRTNLFAPPTVISNDVFRAEPGIMQPSYTRYHPHQPHRQQIYRAGGQDGPTAIHTTPMRRVGRGAKVTRTGSDQFCGLSAEITRELAYRTPTKTPPKTTPKKSVISQLSRDLFRTNASPPATEGKLMNLRLVHTESMSTSDCGSPRENVPPMLLNQQPQPGPATASKKKVPPNLLDTPGKDLPKAQGRRSLGAKPRARKTPFPKRSARKKMRRCLTPPRTNFGSHVKPTPRTSAAAAHTLSTSYDGVEDFRQTSSEHDPEPFQVELPLKREVVVHCKICALLDGYTAIHRDFNFAVLCGVARSTLEREYERSTCNSPMIAGSCHRNVVRQLLECADDLVVDGFFREYAEESSENGSERMEACIFSSESLRQIIVCFRGSTASQAKPVGSGKQVSCILDVEQQVPILSTLHRSYFGTPLEGTVFAMLANLSSRKPFFDVVMTGHSFGASMATIASVRYAWSNSQMRVACHAFGSPKIGREEWRQLVHSVPNLRVYRTENGSDSFVTLPGGNEWVHCGHAIQITCDNTTTPSGGDDGKEAGVEFKARRFPRDAAQNNNNHLNLLGFVQSRVIPRNLTQASAQAKSDHEIQSYVERLAQSGDKWVVDFCELKGKGVSGTDNERRTLA